MDNIWREHISLDEDQTTSQYISKLILCLCALQQGDKDSLTVKTTQKIKYNCKVDRSERSSGKDTIGSRSSDSMLQCLSPLFVKFASYNTSLSIHERSKVDCFVPWSRTCINNLSLNVQTEINIRDYITIKGDMTNWNFQLVHQSATFFTAPTA